VFIARFVPLFPPFAANVLAGMTKMPLPTFLYYNLGGAAVWAPGYILVGYFFGKKWKLLAAWLGPTASYLILPGIALVVFGVIFRHSISGLWERLFPQKG